MSKKPPLRPYDDDLSDLSGFPEESFAGDLRGLPADHPLHPERFFNPLKHHRAVLEAVRNFRLDPALIAALCDPVPAPRLTDDSDGAADDADSQSGLKLGLRLERARSLDRLFDITLPESPRDARTRAMLEEILAYLTLATGAVSRDDLEDCVFSLFREDLTDEEGLALQNRLSGSGIDPSEWRRRILAILPFEPNEGGTNPESGCPLAHQYARLAGFLPDSASMTPLNSPVEGQTGGPVMPDFEDDPYSALETPEDPITVMLVTDKGMSDLQAGPLGRFLPEQFQRSIDDRLRDHLADPAQEVNARAMLEQAYPHISAMRISPNVWAVTFRGMWRREVECSFESGKMTYVPDVTVTAFARVYGFRGNRRTHSDGTMRRAAERRYSYEQGPVVFDDERVEFTLPFPDDGRPSELIALFCTGPRAALSPKEPESALFAPQGCRPRKHATITDHSAGTGRFSVLRNAERGWDGYERLGKREPAGRIQDTFGEEIRSLLADLDGLEELDGA